MKPLLRLLYISRVKPGVDHEQIMSILEKAHHHNPLRGITGMLYYSGGVFFQVIEGPEQDVMALYLKIAADPRHSDMVLLYAATIEQAIFSCWDMAYIADLNELVVNYDALLAMRCHSNFESIITRCLQHLLATDTSTAL
jgi:hypothetical protein